MTFGFKKTTNEYEIKHILGDSVFQLLKDCGVEIEEIEYKYKSKVGSYKVPVRIKSYLYNITFESNFEDNSSSKIFMRTLYSLVTRSKYRDSSTSEVRRIMDDISEGLTDLLGY